MKLQRLLEWVKDYEEEYDDFNMDAVLEIYGDKGIDKALEPLMEVGFNHAEAEAILSHYML